MLARWLFRQFRYVLGDAERLCFALSGFSNSRFVSTRSGLGKSATSRESAMGSVGRPVCVARPGGTNRVFVARSQPSVLREDMQVQCRCIPI